MKSDGIVSENIRTIGRSTADEIQKRKDFLSIFDACSIPQEEILSNLGLFINRQSLQRILFFSELYKKIVDLRGIIIEFGVRWGQNLALFANLRGMFEPFNYNRKIVGFDTFEGFPKTSDRDNNGLKAGDYGVSENYETYLSKVLDYHESESPVAHIKKYEIIKGDAVFTLKKYLQEYPETIIALAYFDFDLYEPTKKCLELIRDHLTRGAVIGFDDLNTPDFKGETLALKEVLGLNRYKIQKSAVSPLESYVVFE